MRNFPKKIATAEDIRNCKQLVGQGVFAPEELLAAIKELESVNYLHCPIRAIGEDRKSVTLNYCSEAKANTKAIIGGKTVTITTVTHEEGETKESMDAQLETTIITTSAMVAIDAEIAEIPAPSTIYETIGITAEELNQIKEDLQNE